MRSRYDAQRAIICPAVIEVHTHGNDRFQDGDRWLDVQNAFLL